MNLYLLHILDFGRLVYSTDRSKAVVPALSYFMLLCGMFYEATCFKSSSCFFVLFSPFSIAITSLGEERANLSAFRTFVRVALVWFCLFPLPLGVWEGLWLVIVALPGLFSYLFLTFDRNSYPTQGKVKIEKSHVFDWHGLYRTSQLCHHNRANISNRSDCIIKNQHS